MTNETDVLFGREVVSVGDKELEIKKFTWEKTIYITPILGEIIIGILPYAEDIVNKIKYLQDLGEDAGAVEVAVAIAEIISKIDKKTLENFNKIIAISAGLTKKEMEQLELEEGINLVVAIYNVNKGFFTKYLTVAEQK